MRTIAIINQAAWMREDNDEHQSRRPSRTTGAEDRLSVDMDPWRHCGVGFWLCLKTRSGCTIYDTLIEESDGKRRASARSFWQIATDFLDSGSSNIKLAGVQATGLRGRAGRDDRLTQRARHWKCKATDHWAIIDCPPSVGLITFTLLRACG